MDLQAIRLLLVEDNPGDARLIRELLRQAEPFPFELVHVETLRAATEHLARGETDAVLLDLTLPDTAGLDTVVQARNAAPEVPIVVLSGLSDERVALEAVHVGAQDYLAKGEITGRLLSHAIRYAIERSRLERERWNLLHREQRAREAAEAAVQSREELLAIVAHDLRNPLAAINVTVGLLRQGEVPPEQCAHQLDVVIRSTEQMDRLIQDLLDVARIESGTLWVEPEPVPVAALLESASVLLEGPANESGLLLQTHSEPGVPEVLVDPQQILRVFSNLVGNARRFTPRGGSITLRARRFGDAVLFSVTDTGVGVPPEELPHLFDRRWQAEHPSRDGTGRGLAIAKGIVTAHRGRIWAASEPGKGSTFFFTLRPAAARDEAEAEATPGAGGQDAAHARAEVVPECAVPLRVVLVDDHAAIRRGLAAVLSRAEGIEVVGEGATGEEALALTERLRPDVVVMDLAMPGMGGVEATRQITASMDGVRVLALTAEDEREALLPILRAGGSGFVRKTGAHEDLVPALAMVARDEVFLYPSGHRLLLGDFLRERDAGPLDTLSEQEREILRLTAEGFNSAEIGKKLFLSPKTIDSYRSRLMRQLGLSGRSELVRLALRSGLLRPEPPATAPDSESGGTSPAPARRPAPALLAPGRGE